VQRVPRTEKQGRMHTSTMTVAVLPQPTEVGLITVCVCVCVCSSAPLVFTEMLVLRSVSR